MALAVRVIPCLDVDNGRVVKGVNFVDLIDAGADLIVFPELQLIGYPPAEHADRAGEWDYAADGAVIPHPLYAKLGWVSVVNPGAGPEVVALLERARAHVQKR